MAILAAQSASAPAPGGALAPPLQQKGHHQPLQLTHGLTNPTMDETLLAAVDRWQKPAPAS